MMKLPKSTIPLLLVLLGFLIYSNVLHGPFILDDEWFISNNNQIRNISNFFKDFSGTRYIGFLSFAINYYFGGLNTFGYHLVNIIIHIINAVLVYFFVSLTLTALSLRGALAPKQSQGEIASALPRNDTAYNFIAFSVSLIFLVHPIQTQAVSYITQRFTSLATFFYLSALVLYVKARLKIQDSRLNLASCNLYLASIFSAVLAMKTKELSFTLPFIIILYEFIFFKSRPETSGYKRFLYLTPYLLTLLIIPLDLLFMRANPSAERMLQDTLQREMSANPLSYTSILTQFNVMATYIRLLFIPLNQNLWYDYPMAHSIFEMQTFSSLLLIIFIIGFTVYLYLKSRMTDNAYGILISFGIFWFFITLSVVSVMPLSGVIFEHWLYLPSIGFILSITAVMSYGFDCLEEKAKKTLITYFVLIIIAAAAVFSFAAYKRNILWRDDILMWIDVVKKSPNKSEAHYNLGNVYAKHGMMDKAAKEFLTALKLKPNFIEAHFKMGLVYYEQGILDKAIEEYLIVLKLTPSNYINVYVDAYNNIGNIYFIQGLLDDAIKKYLSAIKLKSDSVLAHYGLGNAYKMKGFKDDARREFEIALKLNPSFSEARKALETLM